jgi:hypothetical protein
MLDGLRGQPQFLNVFIDSVRFVIQNAARLKDYLVILYLQCTKLKLNKALKDVFFLVEHLRF